MLNEEKELLAALLRLFIANPTGNPLTRGQMMDAAKVALDALTTPKPEPVAFLNAAELSRGVVAGEVDSAEWGPGMLAVYAAPPVLADLLPGKKSLYDYEHVGYERFVSGIKAREWNACLAEVKRRLNLIDGGEWKMVPVEPTEDMVIHGFESKPRQLFSDAASWEEFEAMSGCHQAAHIATLCYKAMLAAAPEAPC